MYIFKGSESNHQRHGASPYAERDYTPSGLREVEESDVGFSGYGLGRTDVVLAQGYRASPYIKRDYTPSGLRKSVVPLKCNSKFINIMIE